MMTHIFQLDEIKEAAQLLRAGQLVAFPTETVYGLGANALNQQAVRQVYLAKGRPSDNPLIIHVASSAMVEAYAIGPLSIRVRRLMAAFWPGPLTIILRVRPGVFSKTVTGGLTTAAFRCPDYQPTRELIQIAGVPIVGPSANTSGKPSPTTAHHVYHDLHGKVAGIIDGGPTRMGLESTVLDLSTLYPTILRPGAVTQAAIESVIGSSIGLNHQQVAPNEVPKAPGMKYRHYAPDVPVYIVDQDSDWRQVVQWVTDQPAETIGLMAFNTVLQRYEWPSTVVKFSLGADLSSASARLFSGLRRFDNCSSVRLILCQGSELLGLGVAYMNRLSKAAGGAHFYDLLSCP